ncbi:MAG: Sec-independent protein translocase protein TatB [Xanthobacteraceae bacterium]
MFDIGWSELLLIGIVALIVIGPKELPGALRTLGQWMGKIRRMASEFQGQFQDAMREAELADLKKEMDEMAAKAEGYGQFDPLEDVRKDIEQSVGDLPPLESIGEEKPADVGAAQNSGAAPSDEPQLPLPEPVAAAEPAAAEPAVAKPDAGKAPA